MRTETERAVGLVMLRRAAGIGCVPLFNLMEDATAETAERSFAVDHQKSKLSDGRTLILRLSKA